MLTESTTSPAAADGCAWWNLACQGGEALADSGLSVVTKAIATGVTSLLGQITRVIDESTQVPLADAGYRETYRGFLGLAVPLIIVILLAALLMASLRRDPSTFTRAVSGLVVATVGGGLYIGFAQLLIAIDNWLSHSIVRVTGHGLPDGIASLATGFEAVAGYQGDVAANMLLIILMLIVLLAGLMLWFVLVLRKIAILVVVAFAPLLIAGWLWSPTRSWARRATEVLVALVFTKSAIFALFGIGLSILFTSGGQSLSDFVGAVILLCGACFAPLLMLRLVHFAADSQIAGDMMGTLRGGVQPVLSHLPSARSATRPMGRHDLASQYGHGSSIPSPVTAGRIDVGASPNANLQQSGTTSTSPGVAKATTSATHGAASSGLAGMGAGATYAFTSRTSQRSGGTTGPTRTAGNQQPRHDDKGDVDGPVALGPTPDADNPQEPM